MAVLGLVVVGVLVTGGFYAANQESRIGESTERAGQAIAIAEEGANEVMQSWDQADVDDWAVWDDDTISASVEGGAYDVIRTRVGRSLWFLDATGTVTEGGRYAGASRRIGIMARIIRPQLEPDAGLSTVGGITFGGSAQIDGNDSNPTAWGTDCDAEGDANPGVLVDDLDNIDYSGSDSADISGDPPTSEDTTLTGDDLFEFGDLEWQDLIDMANIELTPSTYSSVNPTTVSINGVAECDPTDIENWGEPLNPTHACYDYFPIIYSPGNLKITGDRGQGILLVDGDLHVQGGFEFYGPVYVTGTLTTQGTGGHFNGGVVAKNAELETNTVLGNAVVKFSRCSIERAILNNANLSRVRPVQNRNWVDLSILES